MRWMTLSPKMCLTPLRSPYPRPYRYTMSKQSATGAPVHYEQTVRPRARPYLVQRRPPVFVGLVDAIWGLPHAGTRMLVPISFSST